MAHTVKAYMSEAHPTERHAVMGLRPDLYLSDKRWLEMTQANEAARILADVEPNRAQGWYVPIGVHGLDINQTGTRVEALALAESLSAFVAGDGVTA